MLSLFLFLEFELLLVGLSPKFMAGIFIQIEGKALIPIFSTALATQSLLALLNAASELDGSSFVLGALDVFVDAFALSFATCA